ncbi:MAG TPA: phosphate/phosphite/phosphonate ABC transporter substrate-binding protein [Synergistaceae bacterium]|nr:phosphate/phosphite/phosphonate ABC transporter substrate-binding protein [Synergistaceae bacterium]HPQ37247.1 phosphate/phosphite/phosphonate ABC transporter substrate-binding protein [Synergistaceae bacterium]
MCTPLPGSAKGAYTFATYPTNDPARVYAAFRVLGEFVAEETGWDVRVVVTRNYEEMQRRLLDGSVDFAIVSPSAYVRFSSRFSYVATYAEWNEKKGALTPYYRSVIISLKESPVMELRDLKGKNFGFTDRESTSGHRIPRLMLHAADMEPESFFGNFFYLGRHDAVIQALLAGSIEGGAVSDGTLENAISRYGDRFRVLAVSDPIPLDAVVASPSVSEEHRELLCRTLLSISPDSPSMRALQEHLGWPAAGFVELEDAFYNSLRAAFDLPLPESGEGE